MTCNAISPLDPQELASAHEKQWDRILGVRPDHGEPSQAWLRNDLHPAGT